MVMEFLNRLILRGNQMGVFHCGVQVHEEEWSFMFLANEGSEIDNPSGTGVLQYKPRQFPRYKFCESIKIGYTELSATKTREVVLDLAEEWAAHSYHITRRNCLLFAEVFVEKLGLAHCFPEWLKGASGAIMRSPGISSFVDSTWECTKWYMLLRYGTDEKKPCKCCAVTTGLESCRACAFAQSYSGRFVQCASCENSEQVVVSCSSEDIVGPDLTFQESESDLALSISTCGEAAYCIVHSFTRIDTNILEICFEAVETTPGELPCDPMNSKIVWKGGSLSPISTRISRDDRHEERHTLVGAIFYENVPCKFLDGEELWFQYGSPEHSFVLLTNRRRPVAKHTHASECIINEALQRENFIIFV